MHGCAGKKNGAAKNTDEKKRGLAALFSYCNDEKDSD